MIGIVAVIAIGIIYVINQNRIPDLHGMSVSEAEEYLRIQKKPYALGKQVGFVEPKFGQGKLLGKISAQMYNPPINDGDIGIFDYKLYQIDVSKLEQYVSGDGTGIGAMDSTELAKQLEEFKQLAKELSELEGMPMEMPVERVEEFVPPPPPRREVPRRKRVQKIIEVSYDAPKTDRNRLRFAVPDRPSTTNVHKSKESFFW